MTAPNPCRARRAGCTGDPEPGRSKCAHCRAVLARDEATRRAARRAACACIVCGADADVGADGQPLGTCPTHREYFRSRAVADRALIARVLAGGRF